jgi:protein FAM32A
MEKKTKHIPGMLKLKTHKTDPTLKRMKQIMTKDVKDIRNTTTGHISKDEESYLRSLEGKIKGDKTFGYITSDNDNRTEAERLFDERKLKKLPEKIKKEVTTNFKQKYENYSKNLSRLPEHYDIPKVGPG